MMMKHLKNLAIVGSLFAASASLSLGQATTTYTVAYDLDGSAANQSFGNSVCNAGDVNGDGINDLVVGARGDATNGANAGSVRVYSGANGTLLHTFMGNASFDQFGYSVSCAGDVNGDGFDDVVVGAPFADAGGVNAGNAKILSGIDGTLLHNFDGSGSFTLLGESVSGAGDVNNDGFDDVVVGIRGDATNGLGAGAARVYSGVDGTILYTFLGDNAGDGLGNSVSGAGDANGDGYDDIVVGATGDDNNGNSSGALRVYSGFDGNVLFTRFGDSDFCQLGSSVSNAGDVNRDGFADVVTGAPYANANGPTAGLVRVYSGLDGSTLHSLTGAMANDQFGLSVSGAGDTNGDGHDDIIVGAYRDGTTLSNSGHARVISGVDGSTLADIAGDSDLDYFGQSVSSAGDINGDGFADVLVGAYAADADTALDAGRVVLLLAPTLPVLNYYSNLSPLNTLELDWIPDGNDVNSVTGTIETTGATPNANGFYFVSVLADDLDVFGIVNFLITGGAAYEVVYGGFLFDAAGTLTVPGIVRSSPGLAGQNVYIQHFETAPVIRASNGLRVTLTDIVNG
ncbi:MAG: hypothetical protein ACI97A_000027 [Planctomycetota bacterium]|jgi:hypothetical protein